MNVLVTGGAGFIGSALVERLLACGHRVTVVDAHVTDFCGRVRTGATLHEADIAGSGLAAAFAAAAPEAVFHLAARTSVAASVLRPVEDAAVNVCGTVNVLAQSAARDVRRFVFASTGGALYGDGAPLPTPEDHPPAPMSPYGASKAAGEVYVRATCRAGAMRYTILRFANVYGPGEGLRGESGVIGAFARAMLAGARPVIHGDGRQSRDFVYIDDAVEAALGALAMEDDGVFNVGAGVARTVTEVYEMLAAALGHAGAPVRAPARAAEQRRSCLDCRRARRVLGWTPRVAFAEGIARTLAWMRAGAPPAERLGRGGGP